MNWGFIGVICAIIFGLLTLFVPYHLYSKSKLDSIKEKTKIIISSIERLFIDCFAKIVENSTVDISRDTSEIYELGRVLQKHFLSLKPKKYENLKKYQELYVFDIIDHLHKFKNFSEVTRKHIVRIEVLEQQQIDLLCIEEKSRSKLLEQRKIDFEKEYKKHLS